MKLLGVFAVLPVLCFAFTDLGIKYGDMDWLTRGYAAWPLMLAPVGFLIVFIMYRELTFNSPKGTYLNQTIKAVCCLFLFLNAIAIFYSGLAVISVLMCLSILVADPILKKRAAA
ncbi:hypothetical protein [Streptomyces decoyicus]|uniref:hypothetical protein n=1 Tax=Streptomyces decoyicus TaxID=249567 RepID=UPI002E194F6E|nr:hypothetical protein OG532_19155 [Streptomyces decoyicus]